MNTTTTTAVGIDGCRGGWIAAIHRSDGSITWRMETRITDILKQLPEDSTILVDMIIGLPGENEPSRECDIEARKILRPHGARVFSAPPREALAAQSYPEACSLARAATGKAISKQCWHLFPKIRELDGIADPRVRESHPELVFYQLNCGSVVAESKKTKSGRVQRLNLLESALQGSRDAYDQALKIYLRREVARDDLIDALALCSAATQPASLQRVPQQVPTPVIWY